MFYIHYKPDTYSVKDVILIPKHFLAPQTIIKRRPLSARSHRHGWVGCFIDVARIPESGKIVIISNGQSKDVESVIKEYNKTLFLREESAKLRGWTLDVMLCIEKLGKSRFDINEVYSSANELERLHPENRYIKAKIRQQLQKLRDHGFLRFAGSGKYELA